NNQGTIQDAISKVGGVSYLDCCIWSSSEIDKNYAWYSRLDESYGLDNDSKSLNNYVHPVLEF
uniref:hypothetical protein n=1 Tax=Candidatus Scatocola faecigallinarum TaxID=2840916 RepID=UPI0040263100